MSSQSQFFNLFDDSFVSELATRAQQAGGIGYNNKYNQERLQGRGVRRAPGLCRYSDFAAEADPIFQNYNANSIYKNANKSAGIYVGEGPVSLGNYSNFNRFLSDVAFNPNVERIVAVGASQEGNTQKFLQWFDPNFLAANAAAIEKNEGFRIEVVKTHETGSEYFTKQTLQITDLRGKMPVVKKLDVTHLHHWEDKMALSAEVSNDPALITELSSLVDQEGTFLHCSAGVGRSSSLVLASVTCRLMEEQPELFASREQALDTVQCVWDHMNQHRTSVQKPEQFAILGLAQNMYNYRVEHAQDFRVAREQRQPLDTSMFADQIEKMQATAQENVAAAQQIMDEQADDYNFDMDAYWLAQSQQAAQPPSQPESQVTNENAVAVDFTEEEDWSDDDEFDADAVLSAGQSVSISELGHRIVQAIAVRNVQDQQDLTRFVPPAAGLAQERENPQQSLSQVIPPPSQPRPEWQQKQRQVIPQQQQADQSFSPEPQQQQWRQRRGRDNVAEVLAQLNQSPQQQQRRPRSNANAPHPSWGAGTSFRQMAVGSKCFIFIPADNANIHNAKQDLQANAAKSLITDNLEVKALLADSLPALNEKLQHSSPTVKVGYVVQVNGVDKKTMQNLVNAQDAKGIQGVLASNPVKIGTQQALPQSEKALTQMQVFTASHKAR